MSGLLISPNFTELIVGKTYEPEATPLSVVPLLNALAFKVVVDVNVSGLLYAVELLVGSLPLVVYLIVAPEVAVEMLTLTEFV